MVGMALKQRTLKNRMIFICAWASILLLNIFEIVHKHHADFLTLLTMATALMMITHEIFSA